MFQKEFGVTDQQALNAVKDDHAIESTLGRLRKKNPDAIKLKIALNHMLTEKLIKQMLLFTSDQSSIRD